MASIGSRQIIIIPIIVTQKAQRLTTTASKRKHIRLSRLDQSLGYINLRPQNIAMLASLVVVCFSVCR